MDSYFPIILVQNMLLCLVTSCFILRNNVLKENDKSAFYLALTLGMLVTLCEYVSTLTTGNPNLIWLTVLSCVLNLSLTPILPTIPVLFLSTYRWAKILSLLPVGINFILLGSGHLFSVNAEGVYMRGNLFWAFMLVYIFNMILLAVMSLIFSAHHQHHNALGLVLIFLFMISSTSIQLRHPQIHFSWFCVTVTTLLYYNYYADVIQQMDALTGLLNRHAFKAYTAQKRNRISGIMMIDLDDFKGINDTYGHLVGDEYLVEFSVKLRKICQRSGSCYRLGGDEFCVLLNKSYARLSPEALMRDLQVSCETHTNLPAPLSFSFGYRPLRPDMDIAVAINEADKAMYASKSAKKKARICV